MVDFGLFVETVPPFFYYIYILIGTNQVEVEEADGAEKMKRGKGERQSKNVNEITPKYTCYPP